MNYDMWGGVHVRRAVTADDLENVYAIRWHGYKKYFSEPDQVREALDTAPNARLLLATDRNGIAIGTMRILDRRLGAIELDQYLNVDSLLPVERHPAADGSRLSVPASEQSMFVKTALWKAYFHFCRDHGIRSMIASVRPAAARDYQRLMFEHLGPRGTYTYTRLGNKPHETWVLDVATAKLRYRDAGHPFYEFFHEWEHPNIRYD